MKLVKRTRSTRTKLLKGLTAKGTEYYYSKKPSQRRSDYVGSKAKTVATVKSGTIRVKKG